MEIKSIEPTPSPNTMKLTLDEHLPQGSSNNYTAKNISEAPSYIKELFEIEGVKGIYHVADFLAIERHPKVDWKVILPQVREVFGEASDEETNQEVNQASTEDGFGEVHVFLQMFKGIPMQIKLTTADQEVREGLPERFSKASFRVQETADNLVMERQWVEQGVRYGDLDEVAKEVAEEVSASYSDERLERLVSKALQQESETDNTNQPRYKKVTLGMLDVPDWKERYAALEQMDPTEEDLPVLAKALEDEKASIRRLATVYLGMIEKPVVLTYLYKALKDSSVTVKRTAGDCLSDIGDKDAIAPMIEALKDNNKLVRWRAAMFLYEVGDESAINALKKAQHDPEFEVAMQAQMALKRIEGGEEAKGSVWKQMTEQRSKTNEQ
ncbi:conserved virulence factor C family protein [Desertibacillus haloalkaliphilus]|uniref:conserved virulence factor C family protein n=1 Tax=Desertibacillus haloalkaliphilus TaxID=1328930 RepID=UPI001C25570D|nr:conserved virulence factor C family protein [Desertibacillus haloalkaliphilus]MBU8907316.1 conserved virulence factor C family protein [Desertibacillus haloalkaliphilus]